MKTAISIADPLFESAEVRARQMGLSRSQLYARAVAQYLKADEEESLTEKLNAVYDALPAALDPALQALQHRTLSRERW
jgi:hypothetical protein